MAHVLALVSCGVIEIRAVGASDSFQSGLESDPSSPGCRRRPIPTPAVAGLDGDEIAPGLGCTPAGGGALEADHDDTGYEEGRPGKPDWGGGMMRHTEQAEMVERHGSKHLADDNQRKHRSCP